MHHESNTPGLNLQQGVPSLLRLHGKQKRDGIMPPGI